MKVLRHLAPALLLLTASARKIISAGEFLPVANPLFNDVPIQCGSGYAYQTASGTCSSAPPQQAFDWTPGIGWIFLPTGSSDGLTGPGTLFQPPSFAGFAFNQAAFLQGTPSEVSQPIFGLVKGGSYRISFYLGSRYSAQVGGYGADGNQTVIVLIDNRPIGTWSLVSFTPFTLETKLFEVFTSGPHMLKFAGSISGDHTAFFSGVSIEALDAPDTK